jgi:hypothetical protein
MRLPQELIDRILLLNGWWFAYASGICSNVKHPKKRTVRSAIKHRSVIGLRDVVVNDDVMSYLTRAYSKKKDVVLEIMNICRVEYVDMETFAFKKDIYTFFDDVEITDRIVCQCIRYGSYVTFEKMVRRGHVVSRPCLFRITRMDRPFPFVQVLCDSGIVFDNGLVVSLLKKRQLASIGYIAHSEHLAEGVSHPIIAELLSLYYSMCPYWWNIDFPVLQGKLYRSDHAFKL